MNQEPHTHIVDMRSDTLTLPTMEMRESVLTAAVGDDVFGEDPSVNDLQLKVAHLLGKEAALFVPSGTMGNLICVLNHCWRRGCEVILGDQCHIHIHEQGGLAQLGGVHPRTIKNLSDGTFSIDDMKKVVRLDNPHYPVTSLVCIENTHNMMGGKALPLSWIDELSDACERLQLPIHVDGARLLNAAVFLRVPPSRLVRGAASVNICLSKGLGAPVGSVIAGTKEFIERAVRLRKVLGGGMRQCGVLAAMGAIALKNANTTIERDHKNLTKIAKAISELKSSAVSVDLEGAQTNILLLHCKSQLLSSEQLCERLVMSTSDELDKLGERTVCKLLPVSPTAARLVMHRDISEEDTNKVIRKLTFIIRQMEQNTEGRPGKEN